jgi:hypothetical protein
MAIVVTAFLIAGSLAALLQTAALKLGPAHAALAIASALVLAAVGLREQARIRATGAGRAALAAATARHVAHVWIWGGLAILLMYGFVLRWREWLTFGVGLLAVAALCLGLALLFRKDAETGREDPAMLGFARTLTLVQTIGMVVVMAGLAIDGKVRVALTAARADWAANSIFFAGALAVFVIGLAALRADRALAAGTATTATTTPAATP